MPAPDAWRNAWNDVRVCAGFLTRLPAGEPPRPSRPLGESAWAFPLVGAAIGAMAGLVFAGAHLVALPPWLAATLAIAALAGLTGALHEDGLADTADGFGGGADRQEKLDIMRDSRIGTFGVLALGFSLSARIGALAAIASPAAALAALIAAGAASRMVPVAILHFDDPARDDGLGAGAGRPEAAIMFRAAAITVLVLGLCLGVTGALAAIVAAAAAGGAVAALARRQIGGYTGDVLGAAQQAVEVALLIVAVILAGLR